MARASSISSLRGISIIKAVSWRGTQEDREIVESWRLFAESQNEVNDPNVSMLIGFLVDSFDPIQRGGTGKTARWDLLYPRPPELQGVPILLAGGIREDNATEALRTANPEGIDVASGIESAPGIKDKSKMQGIAEAVLGYYRQERLS
jgi:phosphoribosylanthranilate isomerase